MSQRYIVTPAGFCFCRDCGSLIMEGYRDEHDRMHPPIPCSQAHLEDTYCYAADDTYPDGTHRWEDVYPRRADTRAEIEE